MRFAGIRSCDESESKTGTDHHATHAHSDARAGVASAQGRLRRNCTLSAQASKHLLRGCRSKSMFGTIQGPRACLAPSKVQGHVWDHLGRARVPRRSVLFLQERWCNASTACRCTHAQGVQRSIFTTGVQLESLVSQTTPSHGCGWLKIASIFTNSSFLASLASSLASNAASHNSWQQQAKTKGLRVHVPLVRPHHHFGRPGPQPP